jgi:hypothetical protein
MAYDALATAATPALIIYLLDISESMSARMDGEPKVDVVSKMLKKVARQMVRRSTKGQSVSPRYRIAMFTYNDDVQDLFGGAITVTDLMNKGIPYMKPEGRTDTAQAFRAAEDLLKKEWPGLQKCPAPLICHMTDGEYTSEDPNGVAQRLMQMGSPDGQVLVENIFLDNAALKQPVSDPASWPGISSETQLATDAARGLFRMSSAIPDSYRELFMDLNYSVQKGARLLFPGTTPEMVEAGFMMSGMTPTLPGRTGG